MTGKFLTQQMQKWETGKTGNFLGNIAKAQLIFQVSEVRRENENGAQNDPNLNAGEYAMTVQYNPASIRFQANAQPMPFKYMQNNVDSSVPTQRTRNASIVMSVELIFDDTNIKDAFMADKLRVSASDAVTDLIAAKQAKKGGYSVMLQTNAILAALLRDQTRNVIFQWADLSFQGELTEAQAAYTMFNVSGNPIRSTVSLNITQEFTKTAGDNWEKTFDKVFGNANSLKNASAASAARRAQNLMNFNL